MKFIRIFFVLTVLLCTGNHLFAQPGESDEKYNIHEIKLYEREDGSKAGSIAWVTAPSDSVQKFVIRKLSIMEPVQVLLQALSPDDEVTMQFVKEKWSEPESSISAKGKKIGKKIFRTYKTAAMAVKAKKPGIPYIILVQVGKKLPIKSAPFIRVSNGTNKGETSENNTETNTAVIPISNNENGTGNASRNSSLLYIIIGLLVVMVALLGYFVFVRKGRNKVLLVIFILYLSTNTTWSQDGGPIQIPPENSFTDAGVNTITNSFLISEIFEMLSEQASLLADIDGRYQLLSEQLNILENTVTEGIAELSETDSYLDGAYLDLRNEFQAFKNDFVENMPGEDTEGGNRFVTEAEFNRLKDRIQGLERQVEFLSRRDRNYGPLEDDNEREESVYCSGDPACEEAFEICNQNLLRDMADVKESFRKLNRIVRHGDWVAESGIAEGNAIANSAPGMGLGWQPQLKRIQAARRSLWRTYHSKYDELYGRSSRVLDQYEICINNAGEEIPIEELRNKRASWLERHAPELLPGMLSPTL